MGNKKNIIITGAGSGLGASLAIKYSQLSNHVILVGRTKEKLERIVQSFNNNNYSIYALDVSSANEVKEVFDKILKDKPSIDMLINNAGVGYFDLAEKITPEQVNQMIDINLKGTIFCSQQVLPLMKERNEGTIINVVSTAGLEGKITESVYCASKFGVKGFTESILKEVEDTNLHIHGLYMGGMNTHFWGDELQDESETHLMNPDDIADIIIFNTQLRKNISIPEITIKNH